MRIAVIGTGYVGLVSGACLAEVGHEVRAVDRDAGKVAALRAGRVPIYEPGLDALLAQNARAGRLSFGTDLAAAVAGADAVVIAVGTPQGPDGAADLAHVHAAAREVGAALAARPGGFAVVVVKSTVPVGTNRAVAALLAQAGADAAVASNPEFLSEGVAVADFMAPDRIVLGTDDPRARPVLEALYAPFIAQGVPVVWTGLESAEMIKYAANAFLAAKVTFINEVAGLCERVGADVGAVAEGMGLDGRIGPRFLRAGPGFGGSCFPKDTEAFARTGRDHGVPLRITEAVIGANAGVKARMIQKVAALRPEGLEGATVAVLGVAFKPGTDDLREAPALSLVPALQAAGAQVRATDPQGEREGRHLLPGVDWAPDAYQAAQGAHLAVLLTEWDTFRALDLRRLARSMAEPRLADLRNVWSEAEARAAGFIGYDSVGR
jgi:UDPglucose 6-dehydrogenase